MPWGYAKDQSPDRYDGSCETREEAIAEGRETYGNDAVFWITEGRTPGPMEYMPDAEAIMEIVASNAYDNAGDIAEDWPDIHQDALAELDDFLTGWAEKHLANPRFWVEAGDPEKIEP